MTTEEMVQQLKDYGVSDDWAEKTGDLHIKSERVGSIIHIPMVADNGPFVQVTAKLTSEDQDYVPDWQSVRRFS